MAQICIPLPALDRPRAVDVELTVDGVRQSYHYRVETLVWADFAPLPPVDALRSFLNGHAPDWQLASLGASTEVAISVLFRYRPQA